MVPKIYRDLSALEDGGILLSVLGLLIISGLLYFIFDL